MMGIGSIMAFPASFKEYFNLCCTLMLVRVNLS